MESQEHLVPSSPSSAASATPSSSSRVGNSSSSDSASSSQGDEDPSSRGGREGEVEEAEGLISQTDVGDYELVDLNQQLAAAHVTQSPSTPDLLYHHRQHHYQQGTNYQNQLSPVASSTTSTLTANHQLPDQLQQPSSISSSGVVSSKTLPFPHAHFVHNNNNQNHQQNNSNFSEDNTFHPRFQHSQAAATLNRLSYSRDHPERRQRQQTTFLYNNNFHNQSFTAIHGGPSHNILPNINLNIDTNHKSTNGSIITGGNTFNGNGMLINRTISNGGTSYCGQSLESDLQQDTFIPTGGELPLPPLLGGIDLNDSNDEGVGNPTQNMNSSINNPNAVGNDAVVDVDVCCQRFMPASVMSKLNKLNLRNGLFKVLGEFSLRENLYYGSIFFCMTLIVIVCFVVINNRGGDGLGEDGIGIGSASKIFDDDSQCDLLLDPVNGEVHQTGRYLGDRAIYTCGHGWEIVGAEERVCQASGEWSNQEPYCKKRVYCLDPPVVQHSTHNGSPESVTFPLETVLKYTCYPGYLTVGFAHAKCFLYNDTAQWFGPDITCKAIRCSEPEEITNGDVDRKCQTFGCRISYQCRAGYELVGRQHRYCQADGSWSPRILPECVPIQCEVPANPENGRAVYASVSYNSLISYECTYGYMLIGDSVRRCERNKEWTGTQPHCKEINCGSPGILPNGWLEGTRTTLHAVVTFRCQEGMTFEGPSYRTICQADGRWSHPLPRCYAPCIVPHISHGFVSDRASGSSVPHANTIDVRCLSQFQKTHNSTPVCKNGTWSRIPKCIPAKCTELPEAPQNGMVVAPKLDHGMVGKFECRDGYMLKGHNTTQCFFGNWTGMTPWCKEVFCPFPGFVENGKVLLVGAMGLYEYRPYVRKIRNNRQIMFQCNRGHLLVGGPTGATCIDGHWSPPQLPRCQEEEHVKGRFSRSAFNSSISTISSSSLSSSSATADGGPSNRRHYASYLPLTGQIDLIEEEIVLSHKVQNEKTQQKSLVDYTQPLTHNTKDNDMGDQI